VEAEAEAEAESPPSREPDSGPNPRIPGPRPEPKADAQPSEPPRCPMGCRSSSSTLKPLSHHHLPECPHGLPQILLDHYAQEWKLIL